ncbi:MAG: hypothetical protein ACOX6N_01270 [Patescibacteria group bacterium]|jgi:hypothetical protein
MDDNHIETPILIMIFLLLILLSYAGYTSYKSIDFQVLKKLEDQPLNLPTPIIPPIETESATLEGSPSAQ